MAALGAIFTLLLMAPGSWAFRSYNYYAPHQYPETGPLSYK